MKITIHANGFARHAKLMQEKIADKIPAEFGPGGLTVDLMLDPALTVAESFRITEKEGAWQIAGADEIGIYYGIGKFLHTAKWTETGFTPRPPQTVIAPDHDFRAIYFSVHFYNWFHMATTRELEQYMEDLLLWGYNAIVAIIPVVNLQTFDDPLFAQSVEKTRSLFTLGKQYGMRDGIIICVNQGMKTTPPEYDADLSFDPTGAWRPHCGKNICQHVPGATEYLRYIWNTMMDQYLDIGLDYIMTWPYDEGGCGCEKCRPWGAKGYCDLVNKLHEDAVVRYPEAKFVVSAWLFDKPDDQGEHAGLYERLKTDMSYVDYVMVGSWDDFPRYPLEHEPVKPVVDFPEISMWGLKPWGGRGANPLPRRFQRFWDNGKHVLRGGMPYSEGLYEDILKVQCVGYYWNADAHYRDILWEYINYEYSEEVFEKAIRLMELIEESHTRSAAYQRPEPETYREAVRLAKEIDSKLSRKARTAWRWRVLYIRPIIDEKMYDYWWEKNLEGRKATHDLRNTEDYILAEDPEAQELFQELCRYYHCVDKNGENNCTLPPVANGKVLN